MIAPEFAKAQEEQRKRREAFTAATTPAQPAGEGAQAPAAGASGAATPAAEPKIKEEDLPNANLFPTTKKIAALIAKTEKGGNGDAAGMKAYAEKVARAGDAAIDMVPIPGGEFQIGSPASEASRKPDESPQKNVKIEPFWMGKVEITWGAYRAFMENGKSRNKDGTLNRDGEIRTSEPPSIQGDETLVDIVTQPTPPYVPMHFEMANAGYDPAYPAVGVTQHAASQFCQWLSAQTGHFYRLPTEAEWEYAARAGTKTAYSFGDDASQLGDYAWFFDNAEAHYQKVGTKKPNPWGLYDMYGNVAEHCLDQYLPDAYAKLKDGAVGGYEPPLKRYPTVVRGGHYDSDADVLRSAARMPSDPAWKTIDPQNPKSKWYFTDAPWVGFRVVRPLKTPTAEEMHLYWETGPGNSSD